MNNAGFISRLAPSPTGNLHLGNISSFMLCWLAVRASAGKIYLRIDDIDQHRAKEHFGRQIIDDLQWLGFDWDYAPFSDNGIYAQSGQTDLYKAAVDRLIKKDAAYPCFCSRKELRLLASAPHRGESREASCGCLFLSQEQIQKFIDEKRQYAYRLRYPAEGIEVNDLLYGPKAYPKTAFADFALLRSDDMPSYQLATVIDDARMGVNLVMRGNDLLPSTPRQIAVMKYLELSVPQYAHLPLLLDMNGERLAKRHASLSIKELRGKGIAAKHIFGLLAFLCGLLPAPEPASLRELLPDFKISKICPRDILPDKPYEDYLKV